MSSRQTMVRRGLKQAGTTGRNGATCADSPYWSSITIVYTDVSDLHTRYRRNGSDCTLETLSF